MNTNVSSLPPYNRTTSTSATNNTNSFTYKPHQQSTPICGLGDDDSPGIIDTTRMITLISKSNDRYTCTYSALLQSELCRPILEGDSTTQEIELSLIDSDIIQLIIKYLIYHQDIPPRKINKPIHSTHMNELVDEFDSTYIDCLSQLQLLKLMLAANYMNIKSLLALCGAKIAALIKGQTPTQLMNTFNIRTDYTAAEEDEIKRTYKELIG